MNQRQNLSQPRPPLQFGLKAMLAGTGVFALVFATLRWLGAGPVAGAVVLAVLLVSLVAGAGLIAAIAAGTERDEDGEPRDRP